mgnify:CR=1 FL=1
MKILVAIPHYFKAGSDKRYGSGRQNPKIRSQQLLRTILNLHQHFGSKTTELDISQKRAQYIEREINLDLAIFVHQEDHLLNHLSQYHQLFKAKRVGGDPKMLGFACQKFLGEQSGYDHYLYLEDDLLIHDPSYFDKLRHLETCYGPELLLQPHRFERGPQALSRKCYIDGALREDLLLPFQQKSNPDSLILDWGYSSIQLEKAKNPHSGTYCLSKEQWQIWTKAAHFLDLDTSFVGPLESAASLSIMKSFEVYKTISPQSHHFEVEHQGHGFISQVIKGRIPMKKNPETLSGKSKS